MVSHKFMVICLVTGFVSTFLTGVTLISAADNSGVLKNLCWSHGYYSAGGWKSNIYIGVYEYGWYNSGNDDFSHTYLYDDDSCYGSFCDKCSSNMDAVLAFLTIFFLASIPALVSVYLRYSGRANTQLIRWTGVIFNAICILTGCIGMITFAAGCQKYVLDFFEDYEYDWNYGPSFNMFAASSVFKFIELIFCFLIGVEAAAASTEPSAPPTSGQTLKNPLVN